MKYKKWTLEEINIWLNINHPGSKCLATEYISINTKISFQCKESHVWSARWDDIKTNHWCPICSGKAKLNINIMQEFAASKISRDGLKIAKCNSIEYINNHTKLNWTCQECIKNFNMTYNDAQHGYWCPHCAGHAKLTINMMCLFAASKISRDGLRTAKCNSIEYINNHTKLNWTCEECSKKFDMTYNSAQNSCWCSHCATLCYINETASYKILTKLIGGFEREYTINCNDHKYKLDGYNEKLKLAFEYNGIQHYKYNKHFHKNNIQKFEQQKQRDIEKINYCLENHITLITIPYTVNKNLEGFITKELDRLGINYKDKAV